jgi:hypothetical protein
MTEPTLPSARVFEYVLCHRCGCSRSEAKRLLHYGYGPALALYLTHDEIAALAALDRTLRRAKELEP